ncbi:MAG: MOSC domain-containing protein [Planctomyces sp.]|nr:MOSC domain-containing protein [Planctomyces sp.]
MTLPALSPSPDAPDARSARLVSVQVGAVQTLGAYDAVDPFEKRWTTGIFKQSVAGDVAVHRLGLEGDGQADPRFHGGPDKAVLAYSADHFPEWSDRLGPEPVTGGAFGENLTISGLIEDQVCIGDECRIGDVVLQVTQPRQPCSKLARRWRQRDLPKWVIASGRTGWYFRVLQEGVLRAGLPVERIARPHPDWTITAANRVMYAKRLPAEDIRPLIALPELSQAWKDELGERALG